ncbi:type IV toxin-antitoxin system AbiEi family antitoxin [Sphingobacterium pedocola]|nr:type IV toxin-antitoxin system AbiEi family antitoxin [Sphingobacterium pedocola]
MNAGNDILEIRLVDQALNSLKQHTGMETEWIPNNDPVDNAVDGVLVIELDGRRIELDTEIRREVRPHQLKMIANKVGKERPLLLLAQNILPKAKERLRAENIAYLDVAGNFFIRYRDIWIWIEGNKLPKVEKDIPNRAFTAAGLKVLFFLLTEPDALDMPYREIALGANVALGNIPLVINGLKETGFLVKLDKTRYRLRNKRELLDRWIAGYQEILRPKLVIGTFRMPEKHIDWRQYRLTKGDFWGGESAAGLLTDYLEPEKLTLYTTVTKLELVKRYRFIPDPKGNVEVLQQFWVDREINWFINQVHPLLTYADLLLTQDPRNIEVAEIIFEKYLKADFNE